MYDDVRGWNTEPYLGQGEFYLEYGDYNVAVTVPAGYIVAATGALENPAEVLTPTEISRLAAAAKSATPVRIVTAEELKSGAARPRHTGHDDLAVCGPECARRGVGRIAGLSVGCLELQGLDGVRVLPPGGRVQLG